MANRIEANSRRTAIAQLVAHRGFVRIDELAERFDVTPMTIHRDLDELTEQGMISKVRSGARALPLEERERNVAFRRHHMLREKRAIADAAVAWLDDQSGASAIALDDSSTSLTMLDPLLARAPRTIVTNFLPAISRVAEKTQFRLMALGGAYNTEFESFQGGMAIEAMRAIQVDAAFISVTGVSRDAVHHPAEAPMLVKRAMLEQAAWKVLLVDHSKFARRAMHRQAWLSEFDIAITDDAVAEEDLATLRDHIPKVIVAPATGATDPDTAKETS